jgi:predicted phosphodiesterase
LVLHGHIHENTEYRKKGISFVNAGGSFNKKKEELSFNMIEIAGEEINTKQIKINNNQCKIFLPQPVLIEQETMKNYYIPTK